MWHVDKCNEAYGPTFVYGNGDGPASGEQGQEQFVHFARFNAVPWTVIGQLQWVVL